MLQQLLSTHENPYIQFYKTCIVYHYTQYNKYTLAQKNFHPFISEFKKWGIQNSKQQQHNNETISDFQWCDFLHSTPQQ